MKLLFDENLSRRLIGLVNDLFPGSLHVAAVDFTRGVSARRIWDYAAQNGFAIVTADKDFSALAQTLGPPPKVIFLENCDYPTATAARIITTNALRISDFERNDRSLLLLRK